jgi:hypothetical protein
MQHKKPRIPDSSDAHRTRLGSPISPLHLLVTESVGIWPSSSRVGRRGGCAGVWRGPPKKRGVQWMSVNWFVRSSVSACFGRAEAMARELIGWEGLATLVLTALEASGCDMRYAICAKWECDLACCAAGGIGCHLRRGEAHVV